MLNISLFGMTAKECRDQNPKKSKNVRDYANVTQLIYLSNLENINALLINENLSQEKRLIKLKKIAIHQMALLVKNPTIKKLA